MSPAPPPPGPTRARSLRRRTPAVLAVVPWLLAALLGPAPVASASSPASVAAAASPTAPSVSGWMPYWATATSLAAVRAHPGSVTEVSPFWYALRRAGTGATVHAHPLDSGTHASVVAALHAAGVRVMPTITDETGRRNLARLLADPHSRAGVVRLLTRTVVADGADGIDLDFEGFAFADGRATWPSLHPSWVAFVRELHASLARAGKVLDVTIPPQDSSADSYWVYDERAIGPYVHALRLMAYDYHVAGAGPISPLPWVADVVATAVADVPAAKVYLGVAAYGRSWVTGTTGTCPADTPLDRAVVTPAQAAALATSAHVPTTWDATTAERTFSYTSTFSGTGAGGAPVSCRVTRTVWFDDGAATAARYRLAAAAHLGGIAVWTLDDLPADAWSVIDRARAAARTAAARAAARTAAARAAAARTVAARAAVLSARTAAGGTASTWLPAGHRAQLVAAELLPAASSGAPLAAGPAASLAAGADSASLAAGAAAASSGDGAPAAATTGDQAAVSEASPAAVVVSAVVGSPARTTLWGAVLAVAALAGVVGLRRQAPNPAPLPVGRHQVPTGRHERQH